MRIRAMTCAAMVAAVPLAAALPARTMVAEVASIRPDEFIQAAIGHACEAASVHELETLTGRLSGVRATKGWIRHAGREVTGWRVVLTLDDGRLTLDGMGRVGSPRQVTAQYDADGGLPLLLVEADDRCLIQTARRLQYDGATARSIEYLDGALQ